MKKLLATAAFALSTCVSVMAAPASPESVETLLTLTRADEVLNVIYAGMEQNIRQGMVAAAGKRQLTPEQDKALQAIPARLTEVMRQELSWGALKPVLVSVYQESFDQEEIAGLIAFYQSPIGQRFVAKQASLIQRTNEATQKLMLNALPRIQAAMEAAVKDAGLR